MASGHLEGLRARFDADAGDVRAFEALEEALFVGGDWSALLDLYARRLDASDLDVETAPKPRARLLLRQAQVLEERCLKLDAAAEAYRSAIELDPTLRPAFVQLRRIYTERDQWDLALQLAELEEALPMRPFERAGFSTEMGRIWLRKLGDAEQALPWFERALDSDPSHVDALLAMASAHKRLGAMREAARRLREAANLLRGSERAAVWVRLARLTRDHLGDPAAAIEIYRRALSDDPMCRPALEAIAESAHAEGQIDLYDELQERRFGLAEVRLDRLAIAHDAGRVHLEENRDLGKARHWFDRAHELFPDDPVVHLYLADVARQTGNTEELAKHLERASNLAEDATPLEVLEESAGLASARGDADLAVAQLRRALDREPERTDLLDDLATALQRAGRDEELTETLEQIVAATAGDSSANAGALVRLAAHHEEQLQDVDAALAALERAAEIAPAHPSVIASLERILRKSERWESLRDHLDRSAECVTEDPVLAANLRVGLGDLWIEAFEDTDRARACYEAALSIDAEHPRASQGLERIALVTGDDETLLDAFEREARSCSDPARLEFLIFELARIHEERELPEGALGWFERLLEVVPDHRGGLENAARLLESLDRNEALAATLERLVPLCTGDERASTLRQLSAAHERADDLDAALDACQRALLVSDDDLECAQRRARILERLGRPEKHAEALKALAELQADEAQVQTLDALARLQSETLGDPLAAIAALERIEDSPHAPDDVDARLRSLLDELGRWEPLVARLEKARRRLDPLAPGAFELDLRRAEILLDELQRIDEAIDLFELTRETQPESERVLDGLERALRLGARNEQLVALLADRARGEDDRDRRASIELERASLLEQTLAQLPAAKTVLAEIADGDSEQAAVASERLEELLERTGDAIALRDRWTARLEGADEEAALELHRRLATLCRDSLDERDAAALHLEAAGRLAPGDPRTWQALAALHQEAGRTAELVRVLESELATDPDDERRFALHARLAQLNDAEEGDPDRAESHYRSALELDPSFDPAVEFLARRCEAQGRPEDLRSLWSQQLERRSESDPIGAAAIRLRIAELCVGPLEDPEAAVAVLEPAAEAEATLRVVADPLADLYAQQGRSDALLSLCERAAAATDAGEERARWWMRMVDTQRRSGDLGAAAESLRRVLADRPTDRSAQALLRDCYRALGETEALARLLEGELAQVGGAAEVPLRRELATLLAGPLGRPADAIVHLQRTLELEPDAGDVLEQAISVTESAGDPAACLAFVTQAHDRTRDPVRRAELALRRAALLSNALDRGDDATSVLRDAFDADPAHAELRSALRTRLEASGDEPALLSALEAELASGQLDETARGRCIDAGAELAERMGDGPAALSWLARLRRLHPEDSGPWIRSAAVMRAAGRLPGLVDALEQAAERHPEPAERLALRRECGDVLAREGATGRACEAYEAARREAPDDPQILAALDALYASNGDERKQLEVVETRLGASDDESRRALLATAAKLCDGLGDSERACAHRWTALGDPATRGVERVELLRGLGSTLRAEGRSDLWASVAEEELRCLDEDAPVFQERLRTLHRDLALAYEEELNQPDRAVTHWSTLLDRGWVDNSSPGHDEAEGHLLDLLRRTRSWVHLESRLASRLDREDDTEAEGTRPEAAALWLELGRLRREQLHRPGAAAHAFRRSLAALPDSVDALRGLRGVAEQLGRMAEVADALEQELELRGEEASASERAGLLRRLGEITWRDLDSTTRASRAFAAALEAEPGDLRSLRALQSLFETMEDWRGALDLYESEVEVLGDAEPERRQAVWIRAGEIARERTGEPERALRAYEAAAEVAALPLERQAEWAALYDALGQPERFAEVFATWADATGSPATVADHLHLAAVLESLGRREHALERAQRAAHDSDAADAWDEVARLQEALGRPGDAAAALATAAGRRDGGAAADRLFRAATLRDRSDAAQALQDLEAAIAADPSHAAAHALLARVAFQQGHLAQSERAALASLAIGGDGLHPDAQLEMALAGARAARAQEHLDAAARLLSHALELAPDHPEALSAQGELFVQLGDLGAGRRILERRLEIDGPDADRAVHLMLLGRCLDATDEADAARARFEEAIRLDPGQDEAHAALCQLLVRTGAGPAAVQALEAWAARAEQPQERATRLLQAAELELSEPGREEPAESLLREAVDAAPDLPGAQALLCDLLWSQGRAAEAGDAAKRALEVVSDPAERSRVLLVRARSAEQRGEARDAAEAFREASEANPRASEAALSGARLLRGLGEWREAANLLSAFVDRAPQGAGTAPVLHQLGRLLAGPLEDVEGAVEVYRKALEADGALTDAREALADLLVHRPAGWEEAVVRHRELLDLNPVRLASLRGLLRIARGKGNEIATASGLAILRGLGVVTPEERSEAPPRLAVPVARRRTLPDPLFEAARRLCEECAGEIAEALGGGPPADVESDTPDPVARFRAIATSAEARLAAPALVPLATDELAAVVRLTAELAMEAEGVSGDGNLVNGLSAALGRRAKRRVRKALGDLGAEDIAAIDFTKWRAELRALASLVALEDAELDIRSGFLAWIHAADPDGARHIGDEADLRELVADRPEARALLGRLIDAWVATI